MFKVGDTVTIIATEGANPEYSNTIGHEARILAIQAGDLGRNKLEFIDGYRWPKRNDGCLYVSSKNLRLSFQEEAG